MALQEAICRSLAIVAEGGDDQHRLGLKETYQAITSNLSSQTTYRAGLESLVICAETALKVELQMGQCQL
jgi:hypothetical protein